MNLKQPKISIVIRAYNEEKHLPKLFQRLRKQSVQEFEVIVVDSGSKDKTPSISQEYGASVVPISKDSFSFGRALNVGCKDAKADIILFASAHVYPERDDWLEIILNEFDHNDVGLVYGRQRAGKTNKFSEAILLKNWFPDKTERYQDSEFCNNANCAIRKKIWMQNPYDETLTGLEDLAWAKSIKRNGWKITYNHRASVIHIHEENWHQVYNRYYREAIALRFIDPSVRISFLKFLWLFYRNTCTDLKFSILDKKFVQHFFEILMFRFLQFFAAWRGLQKPEKLNHELIERFYYPKKEKENA